jgi:hypothetical protein
MDDCWALRRGVLVSHRSLACGCAHVQPIETGLLVPLMAKYWGCCVSSVRPRGEDPVRSATNNSP